ncbi:hypothetical protein [Streptomyces sp. NPDC020362]|uniref:hypothetical protein n=1 Tax=Streptomyces sp. NPDC020362 TaxID=3154486 RepID=UPI0033C0D709
MRRSARAVACVLALVSPLLAVSGCGLPDQVDSRCEGSSCTVHVRSGTSIKVENLKLDIEEVSDDSVTLSSHGVSLKLGKKLDLSLGSHRIHLVGTQDGAADIQIK